MRIFKYSPYLSYLSTAFDGTHSMMGYDGPRNTPSGNFEFFSMGASHLDGISKLNATKFSQIG